jgi:hypothetical protein
VLLPLVWAAVPLAVYSWRKTARPQLPPPASRARRTLIRAATALTLTLVADATAAILILIARHRLTWWVYWPITPALPIEALLLVDDLDRPGVVERTASPKSGCSIHPSSAFFSVTTSCDCNGGTNGAIFIHREAPTPTPTKMANRNMGSF